MHLCSASAAHLRPSLDLHVLPSLSPVQPIALTTAIPYDTIRYDMRADADVELSQVRALRSSFNVVTLIIFSSGRS